MGLDVGSKTIGVAISDELGIAAHPVTTLGRRGTAADAAQVASLAAEREVTEVVVGWPLEMSGQVGPRERLPAAVAIHTWDERFSTVAVERVMLDADLSRRRRRQVVDRQAAAYILQGWLDARRPPEVR
jgi:putative Holliday junction resolvase